MRDIGQTPITEEALRASVLATFADPEKFRIVEEFNRLYYQTHGTWRMTRYRGVPVLKSPMDLWGVQDVLWRVRPELVIETGTAYGGSALFYADCLSRQNYGHVVTIDVDEPANLSPHPRLTFLPGSSLDADVLADVRQFAENCTGPIVVLLDSDHGKDHVLAELDAYGPLVTVGSALIVEDTNLGDWKGGPGPAEAVEAWLPAHPEFRREPIFERSLVTFHPGGWLVRVA